CIGPMGEQPCVRPAATATPPANRTPERPPSTMRSAICGCSPREEVRPPTKNSPRSSAMLLMISGVSGLRGSPWTRPKSGLAALERAAIRGAERPEPAMHGLEHPIGVGRQRRHHHRHGRTVEILGAGAGAVAGGDADAGGADPVRDARMAAQPVEDALEVV